MPRPIVIAHRGFHRDFCENTMPAFQAAIELGADMIELDVRRTADGKLVIYHNPAVDSEKPWIPPGERDKYTLVESLTYDDMLELVAADHPDCEPPLLEDVLSLCSGKIMVDIEVKTPGVEREVLSAVKSSGMIEDIVVSSFHDSVLLRFREMSSQPDRGLILGVPKAGLKWRLSEIHPEKRAAICGASFVAPHWRLCLPGYVRRAHNHGLRVYPWTVNDMRIMKRLKMAGADGIITDRPDILLGLLGR